MFQITPLHDRWHGLPPWGQRAALIGAGGLAGLGHAPFDWPLITILALGFGLWVAHAQARPRFQDGWFLGLGYFAVTMNWIIEPFLVDAASTGWMALPALGGLAAGLALFWGLAFRAVPQNASVLVLCVALAVAEYIRGHILTGFPWALVGYVWVDTPLYQAAAWVGPYGMTLLSILCAATIARGRVWVGMPLLAGLAVAAWLPAPMGSEPGPEPANDAPVVRLIHPNVAQADKWHPDTRDGIYQSQLKLTQQQPPVDLTIWPETSVYLPIHLAQPEIAAAANGGHVIVGSIRGTPDDLYYNSLNVVSPAGAIVAHYDKTRLVPFGEYVPLGEFAAKFGIHGLAAHDGLWFATGPGPQVLDVPGIGKIQPLICYEGIFPQFVGATDVRADMLVMISNDAWFGRFSGPAQHLAQARARSIELGLPMLRVANQGISAVIDARGGVISSAGVDDTGFVQSPIPPARAATFYSQYRDWPVLALSLFLLGLGAFTPRRVWC